jgi:hypothetical protein
MRPGAESRVSVPQVIVPGLPSSPDSHMPSRLSHERKKDCEGLWMEAIIEEIILLTKDYLVTIGGMICLCRSLVNGLNKIAFCDSLDSMECLWHQNLLKVPSLLIQ